MGLQWWKLERVELLGECLVQRRCGAAEAGKGWGMNGRRSKVRLEGLN